MGWTLPTGFIAEVSPGFDFVLFGRFEIPSLIYVLQVKAIINNDIGLQLPDHFQQVFRTPVVAAFAIFSRKGEVEPDDIVSDAYYEQMQYVGDLRPHLMGWTALTGDLTYVRSAMEQFNNSRLPDENITSCYPLKATFVHPTYSLINTIRHQKWNSDCKNYH